MNVDENALENTGQGPQQPQQQQPASHSGTGIEIEQSFLDRFSCLGTTDHDELVEQLLLIVDRKINYSTGRFFLEMNNWNLQAAVGCFFDFYWGQKCPSMQLLEDVTYGGNEAVTPNTKFSQCFKVRNNGDEQWPLGCYLKCTSHTNLPILHLSSMDTNECLHPAEETILTINLISPLEIGPFQTVWRLCTMNGIVFGDTIWSIINVSETGTLGLTQQLAELHTNNPSTAQPQNDDTNLSLRIDDADMC